MQDADQLRDTIAAIATAPGLGAVGIVRVSGPAVRRLAQTICGRLPRPRFANRARFHHENGPAIDDGLVIFFPGPHSYTGEDVLELQGHGGPAVLNGVLHACLARSTDVLPIRLARPGEFTQRAFMNHKLDLMQAEAVADLISAGSQQSVQAAMASLSGAFSAAVTGLQSALTDLRMRVEACLDFPEEEVAVVSDEALPQRLKDLREMLDRVLRASRRGAALRQGLRVALIGPPNVGKSSLLNVLAEAPVAIVTPIAGTTRDRIVQEVLLDGIPLQIIDTAGIRFTEDVVEREGVARSWESLATADLVLLVTDATDRNQSAGADDALLHEVQQRLDDIVRAEQQRSGLVADASSRLWRVFNKCDLVHNSAMHKNEERYFWVSAKTGAGLERLRRCLKEAAGWGQTDEGSVFSARGRHLDALRRCEACLDRAQTHLSSAALELFAEQLRLAQNALSELTGEFVADDLLGVIFSQFCIGK